jgi:hypothetical protein
MRNLLRCLVPIGLLLNVLAVATYLFAASDYGTKKIGDCQVANEKTGYYGAYCKVSEFCPGPSGGCNPLSGTCPVTLGGLPYTHYWMSTIASVGKCTPDNSTNTCNECRIVCAIGNTYTDDTFGDPVCETVKCPMYFYTSVAKCIPMAGP